MTLTFEEGAAGVTTKVKVPRQEFCSSCKGTGAKAGTGATTCQSCAGRGQLAYQQGFFTITRTCPACQGAGQIIRERCADCRGQGRVEKEKTIDLRIPPGVDTGTRLRVHGEGEVGVNGGAPGDLYVVLEVKEHPFFERRNSDLYCTIPVSVVQAALGTELQVPGLNGEEKLKIGEGTQSGAVFRIKGKGLPDPRGGGRGDLYYHVQVLTPTKLTRDQRKLMEQLGATLKVGKHACRTRLDVLRQSERHFWLGKRNSNIEIGKWRRVEDKGRFIGPEGLRAQIVRGVLHRRQVFLTPVGLGSEPACNLQHDSGLQR